MQTNFKIPSKRLFLSFFVLAINIILLKNYIFSSELSFLFNILSVLSGLLLSFLFFLPSIKIKNKTNLDFISFAHRVTPSAIIFVSAFYSIYFVYISQYFLINYTDMFVSKINPEANRIVIALLLLLVCVYSSCKGINSITRSAIFIFAFVVLAYIIIFSGLIPSLDFSHQSFGIRGNTTDFISNILYYLIPSFLAVVFACVSGDIKDFKSRHGIFIFLFIGLFFILSIFFAYFSLGTYADNQDYTSFVLSKASQLGESGGLDGFYLVASTLSIFLAVSLILTCINKILANNRNKTNTLMFAGIIFVLYVCSTANSSVRELLVNPVVFVFLNIISAIIIPSIYLIAFGRRLYE